MSELERLLPDQLKNAAVFSGDELVLPYTEALSAVRIATQHHIAILGLEALEVGKEGLLTVGLADASNYITYTDNWVDYVTRMNAEAEHWLSGHRPGENHGYILTSASEKEFGSLPHPRNDRRALVCDGRSLTGIQARVPLCD
jgi:hypothetical protein